MNGSESCPDVINAFVEEKLKIWEEEHQTMHVRDHRWWWCGRAYICGIRLC
jgi:hypothetical protein